MFHTLSARHTGVLENMKQNGTRLYFLVRGVSTTDLLSASADHEYASHCTYTIPAASALTVLYYPFFTAQDRCNICILITVPRPYLEAKDL